MPGCRLAQQSARHPCWGFVEPVTPFRVASFTNHSPLSGFRFWVCDNDSKAHTLRLGHGVCHHFCPNQLFLVGLGLFATTRAFQGLGKHLLL